MTPERHRQIAKVYQAALELPPEERRVFLGEIRRRDESLCNEVESVLAQPSKEGWIDRPALEMAAKALASGQSLSWLGRQVDHYQVEAFIGAGGMGEVYRASDIRLGRCVAIKFLPAAHLVNPEWLQRFELEARSAGTLNHPNVLTVHDIGIYSGVPYIVTELLEGSDLRAVLNGHVIPKRQAIDFSRQIANGLGAAHAKGIVHRDLKPENVFVLADGRVKVLDFGLAKLKSPSDLVEPNTRRFKTTPGMLIGTVGYMSPEQVRGEEPDHRSDIFALGIIFYEMLSGTRPFQGESAPEVLHSILETEPPDVCEKNPKIAPAIGRLVLRCLEKSPQRRFQSASDLGFALEVLASPSMPVGEDLRQAARIQPAGNRRWTGLFGRLERRGDAFQATTSSRRLLWIAAALLLVVGGAGLWQQQTIPLTDKDVLVLADFTNTTGDPVFDGTMREALAVQLDESPFFKTLSDNQVSQALQLMGRPAGERVTNETARDICVREGEKAMISGSIASLGRTYTVTLQAINCQTGDTIAREQVHAEDKEHVLKALASAATGMRSKLGESLSSIERLFAQPDQVTTTSLEAFQAYARGREQFRRALYPESIPFFKAATELDPNFAMAYWLLGTAYGNSGDGPTRRQYLAKAFTLVDHVTERERLSISGDYYLSTGEWNKAADALRLWTRTYPRDFRAHTFLGNFYNVTGEFEKALQEAEELMRLEPKFSGSFARLINMYRVLDRLDEAKAWGQQAIGQRVDDSNVHQALLRLAFIQGDLAAANQEIEWFAGRASEYVAVIAQAVNTREVGQRRKAAALRGTAAALARKQNLEGVASAILEPDPASDALMGICPAAPNSSSPALVLALCGNAVEAQKAVEEASKRVSVATVWNAVTLPSMRAALEWKREKPAAAIELLQSAIPYDRAQPQVIYLRGLAYLRLGEDGAAAAGTEFQKILDHKGAYYGSVVHPAAHVGLARAAAISGDTAKAKRAYQDFFTLWKDADPDIPILIEARREYAMLN